MVNYPRAARDEGLPKRVANVMMVSSYVNQITA